MPTAPNPLASLRTELDALQASGLRRSLRDLMGSQGAEVIIDGRRAINFCSNNYLGFANHPALAAAATAAMATEGFGAGASRLIGGNLHVHRTLESSLASWKGTERALLFNSGYQANVGLLSALAGPEDAIYSDQLNHASIIDGARLSRAAVHVFPHCDVAALARQLRAGSHYRRRVIVTESVFSMDGDVPPLDAIADLAVREGALLVVDEAHAVGVLGEGGGGLARGLGNAIQMGTLGKALGGFGAYVAGPAEVIEVLLNRARSFVFTTALPVPAAAGAQAALALLQSEEGQTRRGRLLALRDRLHAGLVERNLLPGASTAGHIVPLILGDPVRTMELSALLLDRGYYVQGIRPPTVPPGSSRLRLTVTADHLPEHIDGLLAALHELRTTLR